MTHSYVDNDVVAPRGKMEGTRTAFRRAPPPTPSNLPRTGAAAVTYVNELSHKYEWVVSYE